MNDPIEQFNEDVLFVTARQGIEVEGALHTPIGRLIMERAIDDAREALVEFLTADPEDAKLIRRLQNRVLRAGDMCRWVKEIIDDGRAAEQRMRDEDGLTEDPAPGGEGDAVD